MSTVGRLQDEIYLSVDIEADGPIPGPNAMMSIGAVAFDIDRNMLGCFSANLMPLPGSVPNPETMTFWAANPAAFAATQSDRREPADAMRDYLAFLKGLPRRPIFVGYPAAYDFMWHHWYLLAFTREDPCGFAPLDMKSYGAAMLGCPFRESAKKRYPEHWFSGAPPHDHTALTDAIGQGVMAVNMMREAMGLPRI